jgi:membrane-associated phospholipid phosphatase
MMFVTNFADQAVALPLAIAIAMTLGVLGWWRGLLGWLVAVGAVFASMLLLKAGSLMARDAFGTTVLGSPSGHVAAACVVYGGLAVLLLRDRAPNLLVVAITAAVTAIIGMTRVVVHAHTPAEAVVGAIVGSLGVVALFFMSGQRPALKLWPLAAVALAVMVAFHGQHLPVEEAIQHTVLWLDTDGRI